MRSLTNHRAQLKSAAKKAIHETKPSLVWITLVYVGIIFILQFLLSSVSGELEALWKMAEGFAATGSLEQVLPETNSFGNLLTLAIQIMAMVLGVGFSIACLNVSRHRGCSFGNLLDGFGMILRVLSVQIMRYIIILGWSLLYAVVAVALSTVVGVAAGMIVALPVLFFAYRAIYSYRQAVFLLIDNPQLSGFHCLGVSKRLMKGHCWELFVMDLSFLGWDLLCVIPFVGLWVRPYKEVSYAGYYDALMLRTAREQGPVPPVQESADSGDGWGQE